MDSSSNPSSSHELDQFLDPPEEFFYDCFSTHIDSPRLHPSLSRIYPPGDLRRRRSKHRKKLMSLDMETGMSSSSNEFDFGEKLSSVEKNDELKGDFETVEEGSVVEIVEERIDQIPEEGKDIDVIDSRGDEEDSVIESSKEHIDLIPEKGKDIDVIDSRGDEVHSFGGEEKDMEVTDSGRDGTDSFQNGDINGGEKTEESTVTAVNNDQGDDYAVSSPQLREPTSPDWSLIGFLAKLMTKAIEIQVSMMISFVTFPPWLIYCCCIFFFDPFGTMRRGKRYLRTKVAKIFEIILRNMNPFMSHWSKDYLNVVYKFGWGLFWAVYVGIVLFVLLVWALMLGGFMIRQSADKPLVVKESLNFDYTKNSPEAYVPLTSCTGVGCDASCKESKEMWKIRGLRAIPQGHKIQLAVSMTLPESEYNKNLGMFQVRVDFLSVDGQTLASSRRPCMLKFRSEPIRLVQTFFKVVPLVTGYVSEIQTLSLKWKGFEEKDIPTACVKIVIEQRAEFRGGAGIPELYDASLLLESELPFFKRIIWKWRKTLYVWISMCVFITELLLTLICCRSLIIPRTRRRDTSLTSSNNTSNQRLSR